MSIEKNLKYTENHEWVKVEGKKAVVGISDHAQEELGDIVFVELPEIDDEVSKGDEVVNIESVKAAAPVYAPISGKVVEVNGDLEDTPELINEKPYEAFIFALEMSDPSELEELMDASAYEAFLKEE
jgi:glycine cleavage system H protein